MTPVLTLLYADLLLHFISATHVKALLSGAA